MTCDIRVFLFLNASKQREREKERLLVHKTHVDEGRTRRRTTSIAAKERRVLRNEIHCHARTGSARTKRVVFTDACAGKSVRAIES